MYRIIEHSADTGIEVRAPSLEKLFEDAAAGTLELLGLEKVRHRSERTLHVKGSPQKELLIKDFLAELLALFDVERFAPGKVEVQEIGEDIVKATVRGEALQPDRHRPEREIKAVTYHGLEVTEDEEGWKTRIIFDL